MDTNTCFPVIVVEYGEKHDSRVGFKPAEVQRHEFPADDEHGHQIRFDHNRLDVAVIKGMEQWRKDRPVENLLDVSVAYASMTILTEDALTFEGVEIVRGQITGRPMRVILATRGGGW